MAVGLALVVSGCGQSGAAPEELAERLDFGGQLTVVDVAQVRDETGADLDGEGSEDLVAAFEQLPDLSATGSRPGWPLSEMTAYAASEDQVLMRFDLGVEKVEELLRRSGSERVAEERYRPGPDADPGEARRFPVIALAGDDDGSLVALAADEQSAERLLRDQADDEADEEDLLELDRLLSVRDDDAVRYLLPRGVPEQGTCRLVGVSQSVTGERPVTLYLEDLDTDQLSEAIHTVFDGESDSVDEAAGLITITELPSEAGLRGVAQTLERLRTESFCE